MPKVSAQRLALWSEFLVLAAVLFFTSSFVVRCHWTSIWQDCEFTGWVAPIANRLADGVALYGTGGHVPMPPLPFLLTYAISGGHATWLTESTLIVVFQSLLVLTLFLGLAGQLPRPIPLVAAILSVPIYFGLTKTIFYDACTQLLVALTAVAAARTSQFLNGAAPISRSRRIAILAGVGALAAASVFSKQSTGAGVALGVMVVLTFGATGRPFFSRARNTVVFSSASLLFLLLYIILSSQHIHIKGFIHDVFLTGSQPKGGLTQLVSNLISYFRSIGSMICQVLIYGVGLTALLGSRGTANIPVVGTDPGPEGRETAPSWYRPSAIVLAYAIAIGSPWLLGVFEAEAPSRLSNFGDSLGDLRALVLSAGLCFVLLSYARALFRGGPSDMDRPSAWLSALFPVFFLAAIFHSLSVPDFRWTYDNNPLITLALGGFLYGCLGLFTGPASRASRGAEFACLFLLLVLSCAMWETFGKQARRVHSCAEEWPEVRHLRGARLPKSAGGMRQLVADVRRHAADPDRDEVLLLPNDPNVEAWFERPRPKLAGAIVFTDQYLGRYVERDFALLTKQPPKVIVIGPRDYWRGFQRTWKNDRGCERLVDLVLEKLLPDRYLLQTERRITFQGRDDFMDVYVRKDDQPIVKVVGPAPTVTPSQVSLMTEPGKSR